MANTNIESLKFRRSSVSGRYPNTTNSSNTSFIDRGQLAFNTADKKAFSSDGTDLFEIGSNLINLSVSSETKLSKLIANNSPGQPGQVLQSDGNIIYWDIGAVGYTGSTGIGFTGSQGIQGITGFTGSQGIQGVIGFTGSQGVIGFTGSQGIQGTTGFTGSQGVIGFTGSQGIQGVIGFTGSQGVIGFTGSQGIQGIQGTTGFTGSQGIQGTTGYTGSQGIQGVIGFTGSQGTTGFTGSVGSIGYTGSQGVAPITWDLYATNWSESPTKISDISAGSVYSYEYDSVIRYRLVPVPYDPVNDAFYSTFSVDTLSDFICSRG